MAIRSWVAGAPVPWYNAGMAGQRTFALSPGKRVLYLTKDPELIRRQLRGELTLTMDQVRVEDLLDDINTDAMTPAWVCFDHEPAVIARNAYAGLIVDLSLIHISEPTRL